MDRRVAFITGITGQDGSYLAELLLAKGYEVHGLVRPSVRAIGNLPPASRGGVLLHGGDLTDAARLVQLLTEIQPTEVYNLAAQTDVTASFGNPDLTTEVNALGCLRLLEAIRLARIGARFYQASTSEQFGSSPPPQNERTRFQPRSPYGTAKLCAFLTVVNYREAYGVHASNGILFNHESPRRRETFVTRKITRGVARIAAGLADTLRLGRLDVVRDWGYAPEYVHGIWLMLQRVEPGDYVLATGHGATVRDFCEAAFAHVGLDWAEYVRFDPDLRRPAEVDALVGDASRASQELNWKAITHWRTLACLMVDADLEALS